MGSRGPVGHGVRYHTDVICPRGTVPWSSDMGQPRRTVTLTCGRRRRDETRCNREVGWLYLSRDGRRVVMDPKAGKGQYSRTKGWPDGQRVGGTRWHFPCHERPQCGASYTVGPGLAQRLWDQGDDVVALADVLSPAALGRPPGDRHALGLP